MTNVKPYIGVTGPTTIEEVNSIREEFENAGFTMSSGHVPMLGYLVSYKTLNGQTTTNRRCSKFTELKSLVEQANGKVLTMVHYNSREQDLAEQVKQIFKELYEPGFCRAIQLNIVWPDAREVKKIKDYFKEMRVVLQLSSRTLEGSPQYTAYLLKDYQWHIDYVLIDPSGGRGREFDLESSVDFYQEIKRRFPHLVVGFAGGFNGSNLTSVTKKLIERLGTIDFCIDAEGNLRDKLSNEYGDDLLNINKVRSYIESASKILI